jgi:hypothetical protein
MRTDPMMSFVSSCRLDGETLYFIERCTANFQDSAVGMDAEGRIPAFLSEAEARAEIARRYPLPRGKPLSDESSMEEITASMEDQFGTFMNLTYDLDAAREWVKAPGPQGITPLQALGVWELCWQVGDAPRVQRFDPMGMYATHENMRRDSDPAHREHYELIMLGMKLSGIVSMAREGQADPTWDLYVGERNPLWPDTDFVRLAAVLEKGVARLSKRFRLTA